MAFERQYKKFIVKAALLVDDKSEDISQYVTSIMVKKKFIENVFPLFMINLLTTSNIRDTIRDNTCNISLSVSSFDYNENNGAGEEEDNSVYATENLYSTILRIYEKPVTTTYSANDEDIEDESDERQNAPFIECSLSCIPEDLVEKNSGIVNSVYLDANTSTAVVNIISDMNINNLYFEPGDNKNDYKTLLIPPMTPTSAIKYIDSTYSLYNNGMCALFLDCNKTYLYNALSADRSFDRIFVYEHVNGKGNTFTNMNVPEYDREQKTLRYVGIQSPIFIDDRSVSHDTVGSDVTYYSYNDSYDISHRNDTHSTAKFKKIRYFWNPFKNKAYETSFNILNDDFRSVGMAYDGIDPEYFTPETKVIINSYYNDIQGEYTINEVSYMLTTRDHKDYSAKTTLALKKIR